MAARWHEGEETGKRSCRIDRLGLAALLSPAMPTDLAAASVIITGASSGIGFATAEAFAAAGAKVTLAARRADRLEELATVLRERGVEVAVAPTDMRDEAQIVRMIAVARERFGGVDVLVNCAGLGRQAPLTTGATEHWREMLEVNVLGLCIATREAVRDMERRGVGGHVVHVSSMAGYRIPSPQAGVYPATKFAVRALTEALRQELRAKDSAIRVSCVSPGQVETEFAGVYQGDHAAGAASYKKMHALQPQDVADAILWVVRQPPHVQVHDVLVRPSDQKN
jgi:17beta-estradiol 17-dehydrogenase / 3beta-hydroxysteroid 3-dehydrogenase